MGLKRKSLSISEFWVPHRVPAWPTGGYCPPPVARIPVPLHPAERGGTSSPDSAKSCDSGSSAPRDAPGAIPAGREGAGSKIR